MFSLGLVGAIHQVICNKYRSGTMEGEGHDAAADSGHAVIDTAADAGGTARSIYVAAFTGENGGSDAPSDDDQATDYEPWNVEGASSCGAGFYLPQSLRQLLFGDDSENEAVVTHEDDEEGGELEENFPPLQRQQQPQPPLDGPGADDAGNGGATLIVSSSSSSSSSPNVWLPSVPIWNPQTSASEIINRTGIINRFGVRRTPSTDPDRPAELAPSPAVVALRSSFRGGIPRPPSYSDQPPSSIIISRSSQRPSDHPPRRPPPALLVESIAAAQWNGRILTEMQSALELVRRGRLHIQDIFSGRRRSLDNASEGDEEDNRSYQELLELDDLRRFSEGVIDREGIVLASLEKRKHQLETDPENPSNDYFCCICQEDYAVEDDIGKLTCGHDYHVNCITRWLMDRDSCPICKAIALPALVRNLGF